MKLRTEIQLDFDAHYRVQGYNGIAWSLWGYHTTNTYNDETDDWEQEVDHSRVTAIMVGDDRKFTFDVEDVSVLSEDEFCHSCGQIGCCHGNL